MSTKAIVVSLGILFVGSALLAFGSRRFWLKTGPYDLESESYYLVGA